jgi:hypothetical protein
MDCTTYGPYFTGISEEACAVQAGTFCPITDCSDLKNCVEDYYDESVAEQRSAFANYLKAMPGGEYLTCPDDDASCTCPDGDASCLSDLKHLNPRDAFECGKAREYFGFDANFINDNQICQDILQFQGTKDFQFLEEFFDQGATPNPKGPDGDPPLVPPLILKTPLGGKLYVHITGKKDEGCCLAHFCFCSIIS